MLIFLSIYNEDINCVCVCTHDTTDTQVNLVGREFLDPNVLHVD